MPKYRVFAAIQLAAGKITCKEYAIESDQTEQAVKIEQASALMQGNPGAMRVSVSLKRYK